MKTNTNGIKKFLTLILVFVLCFSMGMFSGCALIDAIKENKENYQKPPENVDTTPSSPSNDVWDFPKAITFSATTSLESEGQKIQATAIPEYARDQRVEWIVEYADDTSVSGRPATDFITVTPIEENSLTAYVKCLEAFDVTIKLTVRSLADSDIYAECMIDYAQKLSTRVAFLYASNLDGTKQTTHGFLVDNSDNYGIYEITLRHTTDKKMFYRSGVSNIFDNTYSIPTSITSESLSFEISPGLISRLSANGISVNTTGNLKLCSLEDGNFVDVANGCYFNIEDIFGVDSTSEKWGLLADSIQAHHNDSIYDLTLTWTLSTPYETVERIIPVIINDTSMVQLKSLSLGNSNLVF